MREGRFMTPEELPAKSARGGKTALSLYQHSLDTEGAAQALFSDGSRWLDSFCGFFRIPRRKDDFLRHLRVAALFHDLGKANADFVRAVNGSREAQALRHEHLSALILHLPEVREWLGQVVPRLDLRVIGAAVLSHHLKADDPRSARHHGWAQPADPMRTRLATFLTHRDVARVLLRVAELLRLPSAPSLPAEAWTAESPKWEQALRLGLSEARQFALDIAKDLELQSFAAAVKAGVIIADSASSGLVRENHSIEGWIRENAHRPAVSAEALRAAVIGPREEHLRRAARDMGRSFAPHRFQSLAARQGRRVLLLAACGAGKTMAAWYWAEEQLRSHSAGRVVFLYPTRGTATEGFRDYVSAAPETDASLLHGTAEYELEGMAANPPEGARGKSFGLSEAEQRLFALGVWSRRYFSATVDQFLGFLEHSYGSLCLLPVLADSVLIVDEVHSFDRCLFNNFVEFLSKFDLPVLAMTATLPPNRQRKLEELGLRVFPSATDREELRDLEAHEAHPRYRLEQVGGPAEALERAALAFENQRRVLWVVNTVPRCQVLAQKLGSRLGARALCYHSRFKLEDRKKRHEEVIRAFQQTSIPAIAVTTQVCEMSLDLDADVLITEQAPTTSLIQRFGRANRKARPGSDHRAQVLVYDPESSMPYTPDDLESSRAFLAPFMGKEVSQRDLGLALAALDDKESLALGRGRFLTSGYFAVPGNLRDEGLPTISAVLDSDLERALSATAKGRPIDGYLLSLPQRVKHWPPPEALGRYVQVVAGAGYDPALGYLGEDE